MELDNKPALNKGMNRWKSDFSLTYMKSAPKQEDLIHFPSFAIRVKEYNASQREMDDGIVGGWGGGILAVRI